MKHSEHKLTREVASSRHRADDIDKHRLASCYKVRRPSSRWQETEAYRNDPGWG